MTTTARPTAGCPDAETLAAFGEGRLSRREAAALAAHIEGCDDCIATLEVLNDTIAARKVVPFLRRRTWWLAVAAAITIAVISLAVIRDQITDRAPMKRLIELSPRSARSVEARLSGGFPWATYRGPMRAEETVADPQRMKLIGTAGDIVAAADRDRSADAQQAAGVALLVIDQPMQAIDRLRAAVEQSPKNAIAWSDLAAAQYSAALRFNRPSLLPEALASVDRALAIDARQVESRFNRALILERLGLLQEAQAAWRRYLEVDSASQWAGEARARLAKLDTRPSASNAERMRTLAEAETLGQWAEAVLRGDEARARRELDTARANGDALVRTSGESLLRDAVRAIDTATASTRATLADAHSVYRRGRIAYSRRQLDAAVIDLDRAAERFRSGRSPMAFVARYYAANARFDQSQVATAREALHDLRREADANPQFIALGAQVRWELALCLMVDGDWSGALPLLEQSQSAFRRLGEPSNLGFIESLLADTLLSVGRMDDAWAARTRAFALLNENKDDDRLPVSLKAAAQMEMRSGRLATARALLEVAHAGALAHDAIAADLLIHTALVNVALGDDEQAARTLQEAVAAAARIHDATARDLAQAHLDLAGAAALVKSDPPRAREKLTRAIDAYRATGRSVFLPECFLLRARAATHARDLDAAANDLESGIDVLERSRIRTGGVVGTGVLNAGVALYEDAIRLSADRNDLPRAFAYAERSRAQLGNVPAGIRELQQHLASSDTAVLQVVALPAEIVTICVTAGDASMQRHPIAREAIEKLATRSASAEGDTQSLAELYDLVVRPFEPLLARSRQLIVIADRPLQIAPFAALYDSSTKRYLIERMAVSMAMSASVLRPVARDGEAGSLLAVGLPSGESMAGLPESAREIVSVTALYPTAVTIPPDRATFAAFADAAPRASVIHIAGHTQRQSDDAGTALVFAHDRITWSAIAVRPLPRAPIVVLAACETLQPHGAAYVRSQTLGDGFLAAGARDVVGTLTPIADADASELFQSIHRHLAAGSLPAEAVRAAQIEALPGRSHAWRAVASLTRCIHTNGKRS